MICCPWQATPLFFYMSLKFILKNQAYTLPSPWNLLDLNPSWISYSLFLLWNQLHWCIIFYNKIHPVLSVLKNSIVKWKNKTQEYTLYDSIYKRITKILKIQCSLRSAFNHYQNDNPQPIHPKGNQSWMFIGRTDAEAEAPILWPPDAKNWHVGKDPDAGKDWRQEEKGTAEDEMVG